MAQFNDPGKFESQSGSGEKWNRLVSVSDAKLETQRPMIQMLARCIIDNIIDNLISTAEDRGSKKEHITILLDDLPSLGSILSIERLFKLRSRYVASSPDQTSPGRNHDGSGDTLGAGCPDLVEPSAARGDRHAGMPEDRIREKIDEV